MEKIKRWHLVLITLVLVLTGYNILPTIIYYSKPLSKPIDQKASQKLVHAALSRVDRVHQDSLNWIKAFNKQLGLKPSSIQAHKQNAHLIEIEFKKDEEAHLFKRYFSEAGPLIGFSPAQLQLIETNALSPRKVIVFQKTRGDLSEIEDFSSFVPKLENGKLTPTYQSFMQKRAAKIAQLLSTPSQEALTLASLPKENLSLADCSQIVETAKTLEILKNSFSNHSFFLKKYLRSLTQALPSSQAEQLSAAFERAIQVKHKALTLHQDKKESIHEIKEHIHALTQANQWVLQSKQVLDQKEINFQPSSELTSSLQTPYHPFIESLTLDWDNERIVFRVDSEVQHILDSKLEKHQEVKELLSKLLINTMAQLTHQSSESLASHPNGYQLPFHEIQQAEGFIAFDLSKLAQREVLDLKNYLLSYWSPQTADLDADVFKIMDYQEYSKASLADKKFGLTLYQPLVHGEEEFKTLQANSLYLFAPGIPQLFEKTQGEENHESKQSFLEDFQNLKNLLQAWGFQFNYMAEGSSYPADLQGALVFEKPQFSKDILEASREHLVANALDQFAFIELTDLAQRIHVQNKIETQMHEDLLQWKENHQAAKVDLYQPQLRFLIPPPQKNIYLENFKLSAKKYFRGDAQKVLKWGLDLSGGKSILVGLKNSSNQTVTAQADLEEAANELTQRVNKMGLSEVDIRVENQHITLDFPSSKGLSAKELIKGSTMSFHVVNENFCSPTSSLYPAAMTFLQEVWNEALITHATEVEDLNRIAWKQLGGVENSTEFKPKSEHAKKLVDAKLKIFAPGQSKLSHEVNTEFSKVVPFAPADHMKIKRAPLCLVFNNSALEGSQIENIRTSYDPKEGNLLAFNIKSSSLSKTGGKVNPRENLYAWTSQFAKDRVAGTEYEKVTPGRGWRLAILLNHQVINDPQLNQAIRDNVQVSGGFTQQEVNRLASDLKAGSLSFTPDILSETNVSADLGQKERIQGVSATLVALALVMALMVIYYRFSGFIASIAVLVNLLIIWAVLQNLQATVTLSGIAGIILTLGMAVDANVLVFERIREELKHSKKLATAIYKGYKQAFSAIFDSNVTTILAALILLNFDTGPIKGLAITLTIGISSSMFTALFMTQVFFAKWVKNTKQTTLKMANWFHVKSVNFLKHSRFVCALFALLLIMGSTLFVLQKRTLFGMDFTGGYSLNVEYPKDTTISFREATKRALLKAGVKPSELQIRELGAPEKLRIQLSSSLDEKHRPFYHLPLEQEVKNARYTWQSNPRIDWIVQALTESHLKLTDSSISQLDANWSEMSGQLSKTTRNQALIALSLALVFIMLYISLRFEFKFALSALICTLHDVFMCLALLALLHFFNVPIQINMQVIAALMTIIGYSLNDTIIVFDRIREEKKLLKKASLSEIINHSLSVTLNRTLMTSLTTFIVLLALLVLGGSKIFDFSLIMSLGVIMGTLSSLYVAPFILYFLSKTPKEVRIKTLQVSKT